MNDKFNLDSQQSPEAPEGRFQAQPGEKRSWSKPALRIIDINEETDLNPGFLVDGSGTAFS
jgi:hypothetical protein